MMDVLDGAAESVEELGKRLSAPVAALFDVNADICRQALIDEIACIDPDMAYVLRSALLTIDERVIARRSSVSGYTFWTDAAEEEYSIK